MPITIIEDTHKGERQYDIYSRLLKDRIIFLGYPIDDFVSNMIVAQLLYLDSEDPEKEIAMYINSPGGVITSGMAIYDTMQLISSPVSTICVGQAASMAAVLLASGKEGRRFALPHSRVLIHQPLGGVSGQATDIEIHAKEILAMRKMLNEILVKHTGQPIEQIKKDTDRDYFMDAESAKKYGIVDNIITSKRGI